MQGFFGHPKGLAICFFTEMWERFSFYGVRAILILFMTAAAGTGGLGFSVAKAGAIYGVFTAANYLMSVPGGWIADRLTGPRRAVLLGGIFIALGNLALATSSIVAFYIGLVLIAFGTGLLKPNVSTIVGALYAPDDVRRDAGFSIFYIGINLGAFLSPLVCGYLGQRVNWHYGFLASAIGMTLGVSQYVLGSGVLGDAGLRRVATPQERKSAARSLVIGLIVVFSLIAFVGSGRVTLGVERIADIFGIGLLVVTVAVFASLLLDPKLTRFEKNRVLAIFLLFCGATLFWAAYEQAGSTLNLFADRSVSHTIFGIPYPASWFQSVNSFFIFLLAPVFAWLWVWLGPKNPSSPTKFSLGLLFVGLGFVVLIPVANGHDVSPFWLVLTYMLHTIGELLLSPVGLSAMTKLAPARVGGLIMGIWFLATSIGDFISGRLASFYEKFPLNELFGLVALFAIAVGLVMAVLVKPMKRLMGGTN